MGIEAKRQATNELAATIKAAGFRVFLAERGTYGFYTDAEGSRVVSFQYDLGGFKFSGNYKARNPQDGRHVGTGWVMGESYVVSREGLQTMLESGAPQWTTKGLAVKLSTMADHMKAYADSSRFVEFGAETLSAESFKHYGLTEKEMQARAGSNGSFDGPKPICGNGSFHIATTRDKEQVTCSACLAKLNVKDAE